MSQALSARVPESISELERKVIALQNDVFRRSWPKASVPGRFIIDPSVASRPGNFQVACLDAVRNFDDFAGEFDPDGTHKAGLVKVDGVFIRFDITLKDAWSENPSNEPANVDKTMRVLVIALADSDH